MPYQDDSENVERLIRRLEILRRALLRDAEDAIESYEEHRRELCEKLDGLPSRLHLLNRNLEEQANRLKQQLEELELQMTLARMDQEAAWEKHLQAIQRTISELTRSVHLLESSKTSEDHLPVPGLQADLEKLDDHLGALDLQFALRKRHAGESLRRERKRLGGKLAELVTGMSEAESHDLELLAAAAGSIRKTSTLLWDRLNRFFHHPVKNRQERPGRSVPD